MAAGLGPDVHQPTRVDIEMTQLILIRITMMAAAFLFLAPSLAVATEEAEALYSNAQRQAAAGQVDNAVGSLQQALAAGLEGGAQRLLLDSGFDVLRGEIGFRGLTRSYVAEAPLRLVRIALSVCPHKKGADRGGQGREQPEAAEHQYDGQKPPEERLWRDVSVTHRRHRDHRPPDSVQESARRGVRL